MKELNQGNVSDRSVGDDFKRLMPMAEALRCGYYKTDKFGNPILCRSVKEWAEFFEDKTKRIVFQNGIGPLFVSTVFLGIDHNFQRFKNQDDSDYQPVLWETMIFLTSSDAELVSSAADDKYQRRYTSLQAAQWGHVQAFFIGIGLLIANTVKRGLSELKQSFREMK